MKHQAIYESVLEASRNLILVDVARINQTLLALADEAVAQTEFILTANKKDLERMDKNDPKYDRLLLNADRIKAIADDIRNVATLSSPLGKVLSQDNRPNGMNISRITVPFGVIGIIYEARPNVTFDVFSLCLKSGNASVLKGGSDAEFSNIAIVSIIKKVLTAQNIDPNVVALLPNDRESTAELLNAHGYVDLLIPRGSQNLIQFVRENATIPVIETGAGICHTFFATSGDKTKGRDIVNNAKTRRVSVCNALDCLVIDQSRLADLAFICEPLADSNVQIYADPQAMAQLQGNYPETLLSPATDAHFGTEFLSYKMAIKTVVDFDEAIRHISKYSSRHSEAIVAEDVAEQERFLALIDAGAVYANVSTAFTDGAQFGLGAEIGISTQKLHARGPMALQALTSYKWVVRGNGQTRK